MVQKASGSQSIKDATSGIKANVGTKISGEKALHVISESIGGSLPVVPVSKIVHLQSYLLNGSSDNMAINGSSPVQFTFTNSLSTPIYIRSIAVLIADTGTMAIDDFGSSSGLSNGVLFEMRLNGSNYTIDTFKKNYNISDYFSDSIGMPPTSAGWLDNNDIYFGVKRYDPTITLIQNDYVSMTVRDNLTSLDFLYAKVHYWRTI